jgi:hypothetical protein
LSWIASTHIHPTEDAQEKTTALAFDSLRGEALASNGMAVFAAMLDLQEVRANLLGAESATARDWL